MEIQIPNSSQVKNTDGRVIVSIKFDEWNDFDFEGTITGKKITVNLPTELFEYMKESSMFVLGVNTNTSAEQYRVSLYGFAPSFLHFQVKVAEQIAERTGISKEVLPYLP